MISSYKNRRSHLTVGPIAATWTSIWTPHMGPTTNTWIPYGPITITWTILWARLIYACSLKDKATQFDVTVEFTSRCIISKARINLLLHYRDKAFYQGLRPCSQRQHFQSVAFFKKRAFSNNKWTLIQQYWPLH